MTSGIYRTLEKTDTSNAYLNRGLFFGESPFTTMRMENGRVIGLELHLHRLKQCLKYLYDINFSRYEKDIRSLIQKAKEESGDFYMRITFTKTLSGKIDFFLYKDLFVESEKSIHLGLSKVVKGEGILPSFLKVGNYLEYSKELSERSDCNEVVYKNYKGHILESGVSNIFIVKNKVVLTPSLRSGVLDGVMRQLLIQFLSRENIAFKEVDITEEMLNTCDEIWLTNGLKGVRVVDKYHEVNLSSEYWRNLMTHFKEFCETV